MEKQIGLGLEVAPQVVPPTKRFLIFFINVLLSHVKHELDDFIPFGKSVLYRSF